ncbi:arginine N-succinyltransferase, partial [Escherichia coli]
MLLIRPIEQKDFAGLKTCAIESGTGMTSLPVNDELLQRKIDASTQTFSDKPAGKGD